MHKDLLRVGEAAKALNVSRWTIYRWIEEGRLEATKIGKGSVRIFGTSISSLIDQNRNRPWGYPENFSYGDNKIVAQMSND